MYVLELTTKHILNYLYTCTTSFLISSIDSYPSIIKWLLMTNCKASFLLLHWFEHWQKISYSWGKIWLETRVCMIESQKVTRNRSCIYMRETCFRQKYFSMVHNFPKLGTAVNMFLLSAWRKHNKESIQWTPTFQTLLFCFKWKVTQCVNVFPVSTLHACNIDFQAKFTLCLIIIHTLINPTTSVYGM